MFPFLTKILDPRTERATACRRPRATRPARRVRRVWPEVEALEGRQVPTFTFGGGNVLTHVAIQGLYYGQDWATGTNLAAMRTQLDGYLQYIVASPYMDMLTGAGYADGAGNLIGRGTFTPGSTDPAALNKGVFLTDTQIQNELQARISGGTLASPVANRLYVVFVEPNVAVNASFGTSTANYSGYHTGFWALNAAGQRVPVNYAVIPYPGGSVGNLRDGRLTDFQNMTAITSHELAEAVTDATGRNPGRGWYDAAYASVGGEIADIGETSPDHTVYLNGYAVQKVVNKNDQPIAPAGATLDPAPLAPVAEGPDGRTWAIWGPNRELWWHDTLGWHSQGATGVTAISEGADRVLNVVFNNRDLYQFFPDSRPGIAGQWTSNLPLASDVRSVTEAPNGVLYATFGPNQELRKHDATGWHGVGSNGGLTPIGQGITGAASISAGADGTLDVVFSNAALWQYNISQNQWVRQIPVSKVGAVAAGPHGEVFVIIGTGSSSHLYQVTNLATGALKDLNAAGVASITVGADGVLDAVFTDGSLKQYVLSSQSWGTVLGNGIGLV
jgi:hypothetical protein